MYRNIAVMASLMVVAVSMPAYAQAIDLSSVNSVLQSVLDALTGLTGRLIMTIVAVGVLMAGAFNFLDWTRVFTLLTIIVVIGVIPTFVQAIWGTA